MNDPNHWQPLALERADLPERPADPGAGPDVHRPVLGTRDGFALPPSEQGTPIDPGPPPLLGDPATDQAFKDEAVEVIRRQQRARRHERRSTIDISPRRSRQQHPRHQRRSRARRQPGDRPAVRSRRSCHQGDFARVLAEYWADGPKSETPPGPLERHRQRRSPTRPASSCGSAATAEPVDRLEWDVKLYLALNGAVHDAAIAAWGAQGLLRLVATDLDDPVHGRARPVERSGRAFVRPRGPAARARPDRGRHPAIRARPASGMPALPATSGEIAINAWRGFPTDPEDPDERCRLDPRRRLGAVPARTFVTPAFAGYASGHSTFSRAAAEVLTAFTGSEYFPGGLTSFTTKKGDLIHRGGPDPGHHDPMGDLLRRGRPGRDLAAVHGHPHPRRRLQGSQDRIDLRQGRDGACPALFRRLSEPLIRLRRRSHR